MRLKHFLILSIIITLLGGCAKDRYSTKYKSAAERRRYAKEHNLNRLPPSDVPLVMNERVIAWLEYFQGRGRNHMKRYLQRSGRYIDTMQDILRQNGMPEDLVYVALIESGFNNNAYSHAHAVGPWQFIRATGRRYGLTVNHWLDERRDPIKATWAASKYLKDLYNEFGHWYLAMAGYNAGEGKVRRVIRKSGTKDYWKIVEGGRKYLRAETRDYVPKFIAATIIAKTPENFGFDDLEYETPLDYEVAPVESQTDLKVIAKCAGISHDEIKRLNAHLVGGTTPPRVRDYLIKLPVGTTDIFKEKFAQVPKSERIIIVYHKIRRGETVSTIARRYGVSSRSLLSANNIPHRRRHRIRAGRTLVIPKGGYAKYAKASTSNKKRSKKASTGRVRYHRVSKGDTLGEIAEKYGVGLSQISKWNNISRNSTLRIGQKLKVYGGKAGARVASAGTPRKHRIRRGETLWSISRKYGVSVKELMALNDLSSASRIRAGKTIFVSQPPKSVKTSAPIVANGTTHTLRRGETIGHVAEKYGVRASQVMAWNNIKNPRRVRAGTILTVKGVSKPTTTSSPSATTTASSLATTHELKRGETLGHVAEKYRVRASQIMAWNNIKNPRRVRAGTVLKINAAKTNTAKAVNTEAEAKKSAPRTTTAKTHKVVKGEALILIARKYGVTVKQLMAWNNIKDPRSVRAGQVLKVQQNQTKPTSEPTTAAGNAKPSSFNYKVKPGDTLWDIARRHGVTISDIQTWNDLNDPSQVRPGDMLAIKRR